MVTGNLVLPMATSTIWGGYRCSPSFREGWLCEFSWWRAGGSRASTKYVKYSICRKFANSCFRYKVFPYRLVKLKLGDTLCQGASWKIQMVECDVNTTLYCSVAPPAKLAQIKRPQHRNFYRSVFQIWFITRKLSLTAGRTDRDTVNTF